MSVKSKYKNGRLKFYSGAVDDESVATSTAASTSIANYGVTRLKNGTSEGTWVIDAPVLGAHKTIIVADTTKIFHIKTTPASVNTTGYDVINITNVATTQYPQIGVSVDLYGASTILWLGTFHAPQATSSAWNGLTIGTST